MKKISIIIIFLFLSIHSFAQDNLTTSIKTIKVKPIKPQSNLCSRKDNQVNAVVMEYKVVERRDRKIYGKKIYTIVPCTDYPDDFSFNNKVLEYRNM